MFNGSSSVININSTATTPVDFSAQNWTVSAWINPDVITSGSFYGIISKYGSSDAARSFNIGIQGSDSTIRLLERGSGSNNIQNSTTTISTNVWTHIAVVRTSSTITFYVNGSPDTPISSTFSAGNGGTEDIRIGLLTSTAYYFDGLIDQVRIFSSALSSDQVTELYNEHYQTQFTDGSDTAIVFTEGTGTVTFSGVNPDPPQGAIRANTSYSEDGSASAIEHYNGTGWKYFDAIKYCTTNTLNFPSGAGCIASYNLNNNVDDIGNTYNGVNSNVTFNASGKFGEAAVFNGSSSVITLPALPITTSSDVTFSAWIKGSSDATDATIVSTLGENGLEFRVQNSAVKAVYRKGSGWYASSSVSVTADAWNHVVLTYEQGVGFNIYVNNNTPTTYAETSTLSILGSSNTIGKYANGSSGYFDGDIDQVRLFNSALTSDQVGKLYNNEIACS